MSRLKEKVVSVVAAAALVLSMMPTAAIAVGADAARGGASDSGDKKVPISLTAEDGNGENGAEAGSDDKVVNNVVFAAVTAAKDKNGDPILSAKTGETLRASVYAYNDNPNTTAIAKVRAFIQQTTLSTNVKQVVPMDDEGNDLLEKDEQGNAKHKLTMSIKEGGKATTVTTEWKILPKDDKDNPTKDTENAQDLPYVEFELPAGASVSQDMILFVPTGYDQQVRADVFCKYQLAGSDKWVDPEAKEDHQSQIGFTWTGDWNWSDFEKRASEAAVSYNAKLFENDTIKYTFSAKNNNKGNVGVIYTQTATLSDTLTLPKNFDLTNAVVKGSKVYVGENVVYDLLYNSGYYELKSLTLDKEANTISFEAVATNPTITSASWNPLGFIDATLYLKNIPVSDPDFQLPASEGEGTDGQAAGGDSDEPQYAKIENTAALSVSSVEAGSDTEKKVLTFEGTDAAETTIASTPDLYMEKAILRIEDNEGKTIYRRGAGQSVPEVKGNYLVTYHVIIGNTNGSAQSITVTDTRDAALELQDGTLDVTANGAKAAYTVKHRTESDGALTMVVKTKLPKGTSSSIQVVYTCRVDGSKISSEKAAAELKNVATVGEKTASTTIKTPAPGELTFTKDIVSRSTVTPNASPLHIFINPDGNIVWQGDPSGIYTQMMSDTFHSSTSVPSSNTPYSLDSEQGKFLNELLHQMDAGDIIEYKITLDNESGISYEDQKVNDLQPFGTGPWNSSDYVGWRYYRVNKKGELEYYSKYTDRYSNTNGTKNKSVSTATGKISNFLEVLVSNAYSPVTHYKNNDLDKYSKSVSDNGYTNLTWSLDVGAFTKYEQTLVLQVPGDNTIASSDVTSNNGKRTYGAGNYDFQALHSGYAYYKATNSSYVPQAYAQFRHFNTYDTNLIKHTVAGQQYINTTVLATTKVPDVKNLKDGDIRGQFAYRGDASKGDDLNKFELDDNEVIVNSIYIYNDSDRAMDLNDYNVSMGIPMGFKWLGFVRPFGAYNDSEGNQGVTYSQPAGTMWQSDVCRNNYFWNSMRLSNYRAGSPYAYYGGSVDQCNSGYSSDTSKGNVNGSYSSTWDYTLSQYRSGTGARVYLDSSVESSLKNYGGGTGSFYPLSFAGDTKIPAYTGITIMYAVKSQGYNSQMGMYVGGNASACFMAMIKPKSGYARQGATQINAEEAHTATVNSNGQPRDSKYGNHGIVNSYRDNSNESHAGTSYNTQGNDKFMNYGYSGPGSQGPQSLFSYVNMKAPINRLQLSVDKKVVKNSGQDAGEAVPPTKLNESYDDYLWNYIHHDGLHRTVDGTVTWSMSVKNEGNGTVNTNGQTVRYMDLNASTLVDTIDSPYELLEVHIPEISFCELAADGSLKTENGPIKKDYKDVYIELPRPGENGWVEKADNTFVYTGSVGPASNDPKVRITKKVLPKGTAVGYGYDVSYGKQNDSATQYIIEFENVVQTYGNVDKTFAPILANQNTYGFAHELNLDLTFSTDDSIETNYNSFGVAVPNIRGDEVSTYGNVAWRVPSDFHKRMNSNTVDVEAPVDDESASPAANLLSALKGGFDSAVNAGISLLSISPSVKNGFPLGGEYGVIPSDSEFNGYIFTHADWTDTSYTDGVKTITLKKDGKEVDSINTRDDGNMVMNKKAEAGDIVHVNLTHESVLNESENYEFYNDLIMYDVWKGVSTITPDALKGNGAYKLTEDNWKTLKVVHDESKAELVSGKDYDVYYTMGGLVTTEHHPINAPVNTLTYAADLNNLAKVEWIKYVPNYDPKDHDGKAYDTVDGVLVGNGMDATVTDEEGVESTETVGGIMIVINPTSKYAKIMNEKDDPAADSPTGHKPIFTVDFDTTVREGLVPATNYPNVLAWSARQHVKNTDEIKPFKEDTTAAMIKADGKRDLFLEKTVLDGTKDVTEEFKNEDVSFLVIPVYYTGYPYTSFVNTSAISAIAKVTLKPGEKISLQDPEYIELVYTDEEHKDLKPEFFFNLTSASGSTPYFYFVEMDNESAMKYQTASKNSGSTGVSFSVKQSKINLTNIAESIEDAAIAEKLTENKVIDSFYLSPSGATASIVVTAKNKLVLPEITIEKVDKDGDTINNEVEFILTDDKGAVVPLVKKNSAYTYNNADGAETVSSLKFKGVAEIKGLPFGTYTLTESTAPYGYTKGADVKFVVDKSGKAKNAASNDEFVDGKISVENADNPDENEGTIDLTKVDAATKKAVTTGEATFAVYNSTEEGAEPLTFVSTKDGKYELSNATGVELLTSVTTKDAALSLSKMPFGTYYFVETAAPEGYKAEYADLAEAVAVTVSRNDSFVTKDVENELVSGSAKITKTDADENPIVGNPAGFEVQDKDGKALKFSGSNGVYSYTTADSGVKTVRTKNADGTLTLTKLPKGEYKLVETEAPGGYALAASQDLTIANNDVVELKVSDAKINFDMVINKRWKLEGESKSYNFKGVSFTLFKKAADADFAEKVGEGVTDGKGKISFPDLAWGNGESYYISETVPKGYLAESGEKAWVDAEGKLVFAEPEDATGLTEIEVIAVDVAAKDFEQKADGGWENNVHIMNVKPVTYGGTYPSVSYKTIDNHKSSAAYGESVLPKEEGYSYYHTKADYDEGNYNYVHAMQPGDVVTYTLNVANISDYEFDKLVLIDRMPEKGDTGVVNLGEKRDSEFTVYNPNGIKVAVDGEEVSAEDYTVTFSDKVKFTEGDFDGKDSSAWAAEVSDTTKSFRITFGENFRLAPGAMVTASFDGVIGDNAKVKQIAWNNFAYRYMADDPKAETSFMAADDSAQGQMSTSTSSNLRTPMTPEPPKVGVMVNFVKLTVTKNWVDEDNQDGIRPDSVNVKLQQKSGEDWADVEGRIATLKKKNDWTFEFDELLGFEPDGNGGMKPIEYRVVETDTIEGYEASGGEAVMGDDGNFVVELTNTHETEKTSVDVTKVWNDKDNAAKVRPESITVKLLANGTEVSSATLNAENEWKASFTDLPVNKAGKKITYTIAEVAVKSYKSEITGSATDGFTLTNTYKSKTIDIPVTKVWKFDEGTNFRPSSITVKLLANGADTGKTLKLSKKNDWTGSFTDLPENEFGTPISYTIEEVDVEFYDSEITGSAAKGYKITNTLDKAHRKGVNGDDDDKDKNKHKGGSAQTGDVAPIALIALMCLVSAAIAVFAVRKRENDKLRRRKH